MDARQDFTKKMVVVVRRDLPSWQALNTVGHACAYLGNKMQERFDTGAFFVTKDGKKHPRNSQYPIIALAGSQAQLTNLVIRLRDSALLHLTYIREMIETTDDAELETIIGSKDDADIEYLGVGIFAPKEAVDALTKKFSLWK